MTATANNPTEPTATATTPTVETPAAAEGSKPAEGGKTLLTEEAKPPESTPEAEKTEEAAKPAEAAKPEGAPEKYEFVSPEGQEYDPQTLSVFSEAAREANMSQEAASKFLEKVAPALVAREQEQVAAIHKEWVETAKADKEIGGEKFEENLGIAKKAIDQFDPIPEGKGTTPFRQLLANGLGDNPELIRVLYRAGKMLSPDTFVGGRAPGEGGNKSTASVLYDNTPKS